jgi:hypothetical protein
MSSLRTLGKSNPRERPGPFQRLVEFETSSLSLVSVLIHDAIDLTAGMRHREFPDSDVFSGFFDSLPAEKGATGEMAHVLHFCRSLDAGKLAYQSC